MKSLQNPLRWILSGILLLIVFLISSDAEGVLVLATSPFVDLAGGCSKILRYMEELTKKNYAFTLGRKTGMLDFLVDPSNGSVKLDLNNTQAGKKFVKSKVVYKKRAKPCEILEDAAVPSICDSGTEPVEASVDVTINKHISSPVLTFSNDNMINICQDTQAFVDEYVMSYIRALREKASEYLISQADAAVGRWRHQDGSNPTPIGGSTVKKLLGSSTDTGVQTPLYANFSDIPLDYQHNQLTGVPNIIGEGNFQKFMQLQKYSCCNAPGVAYENAIAESNVAFWIDQAANRMLGPNNVLLIAPNVVHLLWFNENRNLAIDNQLQRHIVIPDPEYPQLKWDLDFKFSCDKTWNVQLSAWLDLFKAYQADAFGTDTSPDSTCEDELAGLTGVAQYTITAS